MSCRSVPMLRLIVDNTDAMAKQAAHDKLAADLIQIAAHARRGFVSTLAWVIVSPDSEVQHGILGNTGQDIAEAIYGARRLANILTDNHGAPLQIMEARRS
jgi:hypothetical protein